MHRTTQTALLLIATLALSANLEAQDWRGRGSIRGQVADQLGQPLAGVEIGARLEAEGETHFTVTTNEHGRFTIARVRTGPWVLHVEHPGFEPLQQGVNALATRSAEPLTVILTRLPEKALAAVEVEAANEAFLAGDWSEARGRYRQALDKLPETDHPPVLLGIARTYLNEQDADLARDVLGQILEIDPGNSEAARLLASAMSAQGDIEAAQELLSRFESVEPDFNTLVGIGVSAYNAGDIPTALDHFDRAISVQPDQAYPYYNRGLCALSAADNEAAIADFQRFLRLDPEAAERAEVESYLEYLTAKE